MWEDQGGPEILCDYGAAYSMMEYLFDHYGEAFMRPCTATTPTGSRAWTRCCDQFGS